MLAVESGGGEAAVVRLCEVEECTAPARPGGKKCHAHARALQRHGVIPELAYARLLAIANRLGAVETDETADGEHDELLEEFRQAFIVAARVYPRPPPLSQLGRRLRRR